ncbi:MAG: cation transporter [Alphaproteobacteria bacterium]
MGASCGHDHGQFEGMSTRYKRTLWIVIFLNAGMFVVEMTAAHMARSQALQADALDFFGDALTYGISLAVIGASVQVRTSAAFAKGISLLVMGLWVFASTAHRVLYLGVPEAEVMGVIAVLALLANVASVILLMRYRDGDANVRSVWLCSRNDAIGNVAVMFAALAVWATGTGWPDVAVAAVMAGLFLYSAFQIMSQAAAEWRAAGKTEVSRVSRG